MSDEELQNSKSQLQLPQFPLLTSGAPEKPAVVAEENIPAEPSPVPHPLPPRAPQPPSPPSPPVATPAPAPHPLPVVKESKTFPARKKTLKGILPLIAVAAIVAFMLLRSGPSREKPAASVVVEQAVVPAAPTAVATSTQTADLTRQSEFAFGDTVRMFFGERIVVRDAKDPNRAFRVLAAEFMDSRCPRGVTCIWAGERAVRLTVTDLATNKVEDLILGQTTARTGEVMGLRCTLVGIDDSQEGVYAEIVFE